MTRTTRPVTPPGDVRPSQDRHQSQRRQVYSPGHDDVVVHRRSSILLYVTHPQYMCPNSYNRIHLNS